MFVGAGGPGTVEVVEAVAVAAAIVVLATVALAIVVLVEAVHDAYSPEVAPAVAAGAPAWSALG